MKSPGAICALEIDQQGKSIFVAPELATFGEAVNYIKQRQLRFDLCMVAIDQPTIVNNMVGCRPVERVAASIISYVGGGVQPSNKSKANMFGDDAAIWRFKWSLKANDNIEVCQLGSEGLFIAEVFPALALLTFESAFLKVKGAPKYNPKNKKKFRIEDWKAVNAAVINIANYSGLSTVANWALNQIENTTPHKSDQDKLDSIICVLIGQHWLFEGRSKSVMIGDLETGCMISPCSDAVRLKLVDKASELRVPLT